MGHLRVVLDLEKELVIKRRHHLRKRGGDDVAADFDKLVVMSSIRLFPIYLVLTDATYSESN